MIFNNKLGKILKSSYGSFTIKVIGDTIFEKNLNVIDYILSKYKINWKNKIILNHILTKNIDNIKSKKINNYNKKIIVWEYNNQLDFLKNFEKKNYNQYIGNIAVGEKLNTSFIEDFIYSEIDYSPESFLFFSKKYAQEISKNILYYMINKGKKEDKFCKDRHEIIKLSKKIIFKKNGLLYIKGFYKCSLFGL